MTEKIRAKELLFKMTLDEKIAQMNIYTLDELLEKIENGEEIEPRGGLFGPAESIERIKTVQDYFLNKTRLKIPLLIAFEAIRGLQDSRGTVFPQCAGLGGSFDKDLISEIADVIGEEAYSAGIRQVYAPNLDIPKDPRWGRMQECFGEDPYLVGEMGLLYTKGVQNHNVAATAKHFIAHGVPENGINLSPVHMGEREMRETALEPFKKCIDGGIMSVMPAYSELDGEVLHASKRLLKRLLRDELKFDGMVVSDYGAIEMLNTYQCVAKDRLEAGTMALEAGVDVEAPITFGYGEELKEAVLSGKISEELIDNAVLNILTLKFKLGLFEYPYASEDSHLKLHTERAKALALKADEESVLLFKNDGILPLNEEKLGTVAVIGNNAKDSFLGDYIKFTKNCVSFYDGMINRLGKDRVLYAKGANSISGTDEMIEEAIEVAKKSDIVFLVLGDTAADGGGIAGNTIDDEEITCAEGYDRSDLGFTPSQQRLFDKITALNKPTVLVYYSGRASALEEDVKKVNAFLFSFGGGEQSGNAFANLIFGDKSPSAKLSISFPRSVGHIPCNYNYKASARGSFYKKPGSIDTPGRDYVLSSPNAWLSFGDGLSYTKLKYSDLKVKEENKNIVVSVNIENIGEYDIKESVLLYTKALYSPITPFVKQLKRFEKVLIKKGEKKTVTFNLTEGDFTYVDESYKTRILRGTHKILIEELDAEIEI